MADFQYSVSDYSAAGETSLEESSTGALSGVDSPKTGSPEDSEGSKAESEDSEGSKEDSLFRLSLTEELMGSPLMELSPPLEQETRLKAITADSATTKIFFIFIDPFCNVK